MPRKKQTEAHKKKLRERARLLRAKIKADPILYEEKKRQEHERYLKRKEMGQIKSMTDLSGREKRKKQKSSREASRRYRASCRQAHNDVHTTDNSSPRASTSCGTSTTSRKSLGRKKVRRDRSSSYRKIKLLESRLLEVEKRSRRYKTRLQRLKSKVALQSHDLGLSPSPRTKVQLFLGSRACRTSKDVKRKLEFGEGLQSEIKHSKLRCKTQKEKQIFRKVLSGMVLKKYRLYRKAEHLFNRCNTKHFGSTLTQYNRKKRADAINVKVKESLVEFFEEDDVSRMCPGKKDCITRDKNKKQKRVLNDTLQNLHLKFISTNCLTLSYSTFCRLRPFWVTHPKVGGRETCQCTIHANMQLMVDKLHQLKIINHKSANEVCTDICCNQRLAVDCLLNKCNNCRDRVVVFNEFDFDGDASYFEWKTIKEHRLNSKTGKEFVCQRTVKEIVPATVGELVDKFSDALPRFAKHIAYIIHQHASIDKLKKNLSPDELLIHIDFSENYSCKYGSEVQSVHFGASRNQVTLHTGMIYYLDEGEIGKQSFCTLSASLRHDPFAIWAHLKPIFNHITTCINPNIKIVNFLSDSPSTQYRNKSNFYLFSTQLPLYFPQITSATWNYSEAGHGKGAPDGIGGVLKRTADQLVAHGADITDSGMLLQNLRLGTKSVLIEEVSETDISEIDNIGLPEVKTIPGTMKVHQVTWCSSDSHTIHLRHLSCFECGAANTCKHHDITAVDLPVAEPSITALVRGQAVGAIASQDADSVQDGINNTHADDTEEDLSDDSNVEPPSSKQNTNARPKKHSNKEKSDYRVGEFVIVRYEGQFFPGVVTCSNLQKKSFEVKAMVKSGPKGWKWPEKDDKLWYNSIDIMLRIKPPSPTNSRLVCEVTEIETLTALN